MDGQSSVSGESNDPGGSRKCYYFSCPKCSNNMEFHRPNEEAGDLGCALLFFGGLIPALLYSSDTRSRIQCRRCQYIFRRPGVPSSSMANRGCAIIICIILVIFIPLIFAPLVTGFDDSSALTLIIRVVADFLHKNPTISALVVVGIIVIAGVYAVGIWIVGEIGQRRKYAKKFRIHPD